MYPKDLEGIKDETYITKFYPLPTIFVIETLNFGENTIHFLENNNSVK